MSDEPKRMMTGREVAEAAGRIRHRAIVEGNQFLRYLHGIDPMPDEPGAKKPRKAP